MSMYIKKIHFFTLLSKPCGQGLYTHLMEGSENKDGQLTESECLLVLMGTPDGSYGNLYQIAIKSTFLGL